MLALRREGQTPANDFQRKVRQSKQRPEQFVRRPINIVINALGTDRLGPSPAFADVSSIPNICIARLKFDAEDSADAMQEHMVHLQASGFIPESWLSGL